jgi:hypothetical protein
VSAVRLSKYRTLSEMLRKVLSRVLVDPVQVTVIMAAFKNLSKGVA